MLTNLTAERLRELLHYDLETGVFTRLTRQGGPIGSVAGGVDGGYSRMRVDGVKYLAHRLAWLYVKGVWPIGFVDHRHGAEAGDGIDNLREATNRLNTENSRTARRNNKCGVLGVSYRADLNKFISQIQVEGEKIYLGSFDTASGAGCAHLEAKRRLHAGCTI